MYPRLITNKCESSENADTRALLSANGVPFILNYVDVPEPELSLGGKTYYGIKQINRNLASIKEELLDWSYFGERSSGN